MEPSERVDTEKLHLKEKLKSTNSEKSEFRVSHETETLWDLGEGFKKKLELQVFDKAKFCFLFSLLNLFISEKWNHEFCW